jgi:hypothetical protein
MNQRLRNDFVVKERPRRAACSFAIAASNFPNLRGHVRLQIRARRLEYTCQGLLGAEREMLQTQRAAFKMDSQMMS